MDIFCVLFLLGIVCVCVRCAPWGVGMGEEGRVGLGAMV